MAASSSSEPTASSLASWVAILLGIHTSMRAASCDAANYREGCKCEKMSRIYPPSDGYHLLNAGTFWHTLLIIL